MPAPTITALPTAPDRTQPGGTFSASAAAFVNALDGFQTEINSFGTWLNSNALLSYSWGDGTVSAPSVHAASDTNTGMYWPEADTLAWSLGGTQAMILGSTGLGIGASAAEFPLHLKMTDAFAVIEAPNREGRFAFRNFNTSAINGDLSGFINFNGYDSGNNETVYARIDGVMTDRTNGSEDGALSFRVASGGTGASSNEVARIIPVGLGILTTTPTEPLDVNGDAIRIRTSQTPASASATGTTGMVCWDTNYVYVCVATNTWKRAALSTW